VSAQRTTVESSDVQGWAKPSPHCRLTRAQDLIEGQVSSTPKPSPSTGFQAAPSTSLGPVTSHVQGSKITVVYCLAAGLALSETSYGDCETQRIILESSEKVCCTPVHKCTAMHQKDISVIHIQAVHALALNLGTIHDKRCNKYIHCFLGTSANV
jgi:hypothetical protein